MQVRPHEEKWYNCFPTGPFLHPNGSYTGKAKRVEHIAKRIAPVKIILIILISDIDTKSRSMHLQLKIILIKESLVDLYSWVVGFGDFWNCPV